MNDYQQDLVERPPNGPQDYERIDRERGQQTFPLYVRCIEVGTLQKVRLVFGDAVGDWAITSDLLSPFEAQRLVHALRRARFAVRYNDGSDNVPFETQDAEGLGEPAADDEDEPQEGDER